MTTILKELQKYASTKRKTANEWFFKTGKGQYGEGDVFIGVSNPDAHTVVKKFVTLPFDDIQTSLASKIHEERLVAVLISVAQYKKAKDAATRLHIAQFYLHNIDRVNNWDLVDASASKILGQAILDGVIHEELLDTLADSKTMWERRVAIIATMAMIRKGEYDSTLRIAKKLLGDKEDLMHKAVGWALREVWKKDPARCEEFLLAHYPRLPRTTLRYAIERMEEGKRKGFLMRKGKS